MHGEFAELLRSSLLTDDEVRQLTALRRPKTLFGQGQMADTLYLIEDGLVKLTRTDAYGGRLILGVYGPNHLIGDESLNGANSRYHTEAEVVSPATVYQIPSSSIKKLLATNQDLAHAVLSFLLESKFRFASKIELLCLQDVEARIIFHLAELAKLVPPESEGSGHALPITQLELADMIGATRETTSTTLNQLEKTGFVKLSRRLLTVYLPPPNGFSNGAGTDH